MSERKALTVDEIQAELDKRDAEVNKVYYCITYAYRKISRGGHQQVKIPPWDFEIDLVTCHPFEWYAKIQEGKATLSAAYNWHFKLITWTKLTKDEYELGKKVGLA